MFPMLARYLHQTWRRPIKNPERFLKALNWLARLLSVTFKAAKHRVTVKIVDVTLNLDDLALILRSPA